MALNHLLGNKIIYTTIPYLRRLQYANFISLFDDRNGNFTIKASKEAITH